VVAWREVANAFPDAFDHARAFVPEHGWRVARGIRARSGVQVCVTDPAGDEPDERLARPGLAEVELLHLERRAEALEDGSVDFHAPILSRSWIDPNSHVPGSDPRTWLV
jgi:hypothetical protein